MPSSFLYSCGGTSDPDSVSGPTASGTPARSASLIGSADATPADDMRMGMIGALAAEVMADAIVRAATQATSAAGIPALRDLPVPAR